MKLPKHIQKEIKKYPAFYQKVWKIIYAIPKGKVLSYSKVAQLAGKPKASRAVGNAMKANPFAPLIPCHRVIKKDGALGGYSAPGGVKKKLLMLKKEGVSINEKEMAINNK